MDETKRRLDDERAKLEALEEERTRGKRDMDEARHEVEDLRAQIQRLDKSRRHKDAEVSAVTRPSSPSPDT